MSFHLGCGAVLTQEDKYVLVRETRSFKAGLYNLPAGTLEVDEDLLTCIRREAQEETGADITLECFVGVYQTVLRDGNNVLFFVFAATVKPDAMFVSDEHSDIKAYSYDEIAALDQQGALRSPIVLQSIQDYQEGQRLPLSTIHFEYLDQLNAIAVGKE